MSAVGGMCVHLISTATNDTEADHMDPRCANLTRKWSSDGRSEVRPCRRLRPYLSANLDRLKHGRRVSAAGSLGFYCSLTNGNPMGVVFQLIIGIISLTFMLIRFMFQLMFMVIRGVVSLLGGR